MKLFKFIFGVFLTLTITSCITISPLNKPFYGKKVGVILKVDSIGIAKAGKQGFLEMFVTPGNRFTEPLKRVEPQLKINETMKTEISNILTSKSKSFEFMTEIIDYANYSKEDYQNLKSKNNVDEILFIRVKYGILVSYDGLFERDKQGYVNIETEVIDLADNSLLQQENFQTAAQMKGNWKKGDDYVNLKNAIQEAIDTSISILKTKL